MPSARAGLKPGTEVVIGGDTYTAPQLNFGGLRRLRQLKFSETYTDDLMAFVLIESLSRNYDGIDAIWLNETIEGEEIPALQEALVEIMAASGLKKSTDGKDSASGEAPAEV